MFTGEPSMPTATASTHPSRRRFSRVLRHHPEAIGLTLDSQGWVDRGQWAHRPMMEQPAPSGVTPVHHSYASTSRTLTRVALRAGSKLANTARTDAMASHKSRPPNEYT